MLRRFLRRNESAPPPTSSEAALGAHAAVVEDAGFAAALVASPLLTVVDFWAEWCQPCDVMSLWLGQALREYAGQLRVLALDVDENPKTPERYGVLGLPTLIFFRDGVEVQRTTGVAAYDDLRRQIEKLFVMRES